ncbi:MAG TPA: hypothetical protein VMG12_15325 [Polyangiaceae bacterium]|nr:hypothetical protein [Polyangiaceae bacterium]
MSQSSRDLVLALQRAAHADDEAFDASLDRLLEQVRSEADPPPDLHTRVDARLRIEAVLRAGPSRPAPLTAPLVFGTPRPSSLGAWLRGLGLLASGIVIGLVWSQTRLGELGGSVGGGAPRASTPASVPSTGPAPASLASPLASDGALASPSNIPSLRVALEHLRRAQSQLREHAPDGALATLDALDARVGPEVLAEERTVTRALALCDRGDAASARALAGHLLERSHASAYAASLRESCVGKQAAPTSTRAPARSSTRAPGGSAHGESSHIARERLLDEMRRRTSNPSR